LEVVVSGHVLFPVSDDAHEYRVKLDVYRGFQLLIPGKYDDAFAVAPPHGKSLALIKLPAVYEAAFADLAAERLSVVKRDFVVQIEPVESADCPDVLIGWQSLLRVSFLEKIGAPKVDFLVSEEIVELEKIYKSANHCVVGRLNARGCETTGIDWMVLVRAVVESQAALRKVVEDMDSGYLVVRDVRVIAGEIGATDRPVCHGLTMHRSLS
jgi:hypothetical protein